MEYLVRPADKFIAGKYSCNGNSPQLKLAHYFFSAVARSVENYRFFCFFKIIPHIL